MYDWTPADLAHQFARAKADGWLPFIQAAVDQYPDTTVPVLMGIGSRETNLRNIVGDSGHGHGIMQIDNRSFPAWCSAGRWKDPKEAIRMGAFVLQAFYKAVAARSVPVQDRMKVAVASYNAGRRALNSYFLHHGNPDIPTTGHNYSHDVLARAEIFSKLLEEDKPKEG